MPDDGSAAKDTNAGEVVVRLDTVWAQQKTVRLVGLDIGKKVGENDVAVHASAAVAVVVHASAAVDVVVHAFAAGAVVAEQERSSWASSPMQDCTNNMLQEGEHESNMRKERHCWFD